MRNGIGTFSVMVLLALVAAANAQSPSRENKDAAKSLANRGMVFLAGEYLPPPYDIQIQDNRLTINGRPASEPPAVLPPRENAPPQFHAAVERRGPRGPGDRGRREFGPPPFPRPVEAKSIREQLEADAILVYLPGRPHVFLGSSLAREHFLHCLTDKENRSELIEKLVDDLGVQVHRDAWRTWLTSYEPPREVLAQANAELAEMTRLDEAGRDAFHSQLRLRAFAYPLTVVGMILAVFALGHLLQSPPDQRVRPQSTPYSTRRCARHCRAAVISLVLIGLLSALDLTWTLLAAQAGQMTELNPIGSQMLDQPTQLAALKIGATLLSCGVLLSIRRHPRAQQATWWLCLVCTVLTFRWLVLNSMFVV